MDSKISFLHGKDSGSTTGSTGNGAKLLLKTNISGTNTGRGVMAYHGFECEVGICKYIKIGELIVPNRNTTYEFPFQEFDLTKEGFRNSFMNDVTFISQKRIK